MFMGCDLLSRWFLNKNCRVRSPNAPSNGLLGEQALHNYSTIKVSIIFVGAPLSIFFYEVGFLPKGIWPFEK
jgi:hypothetical protein